MRHAWLLCVCVCVGLVPAIQAEDAKPAAPKPTKPAPTAPAPNVDDEFLEFLGTVDAEGADEDWLDYLSRTDIEKVAKEKKK